MHKFARMIGEGMKSRGHGVEYWTAPSVLVGLARKCKLHSSQKWFGYADQFLIFPLLLANKIRAASQDHLFVVTDQALGMWVPRLAHRPHVIHCHDLLALRSSLGEFRENSTCWTGCQYQRLIRRGFSKGQHFLSDSHQTQEDLKRFITQTKQTMQVVHIGFNEDFSKLPGRKAAAILGSKLGAEDQQGFLLHVGGDVWYKNRFGVVELYRHWCNIAKTDILPLWMIGPNPQAELRSKSLTVPNGGVVKFKTDLSPAELRAVYSLAKLMIFPSFEEGFGWPIAEALACGCRVLTTGHPPMTEVGGTAAYYLERLNGDVEAWAVQGAKKIEDILSSPNELTNSRIELGYAQASQFDTSVSLDAYEKIYQSIMDEYRK